MSVENANECPIPLSTISPAITALLTPLTPLITTDLCPNEEKETQITATKVPASKDLCDTSRNSDSGKSSSCSPTLLDCSFDSGIAGVLLDANDMQRHKRIQLCQRILLALERDREHFCAIRNRLSKITERKKKTIVESDYFCNVCCAEIDPENAKTFVKCFICQKYICRSIKCADWLAKSAQWECELCQTSKESLAQTSSWVADQLSFNQQKLVHPMRARSEIFIPITECNDSSVHFESVSQIGANTALITAEQRLKIREYVEEIVANLLGGNLDKISVNQLSKSENYLNFFYKYHTRLSNIFKSLENALIFRSLHRGSGGSGDLPAPKTNGHLYAPTANGSIPSSRHCENGVISPVALNSRESTPGPDFADISETRLRNMIQKIIAETVNMAPLAKTYAVSEIALDRPSKINENMGFASNGLRHRTEHYFEPTIYQDLLATAVLNKIVDKQSNNNNNNNRNISDSSPDLSRRAEIEIGLNDEGSGLDQNYNLENHSITSGSSVEPRSDCSYTDTENIATTIDDKSSEFVLDVGRDSALSDYIATHMVPLPNLSHMANESEEDDYMSVTSSAVGDSTWENNWLFKKKKSSVSASLAGSSVGMLVPDPKEDVRAQIGDKTADEISDLSELGSDTDDSSLDVLRSSVDPMNGRLFNKHLIGGQNNKMVLDELIERSSMISNTLPMDQEEPYTETRNENIEAPKKTEAINSGVTQQTSSSSSSVNINHNNNNSEEDQKSLEALQPPTDFVDSGSSPLTGSIAEREYKKWYNAVEMPNNPYAPEALKRRISGSQERFIDLPNITAAGGQCPLDMITKDKLTGDEAASREQEIKRYSRDYYINDCSKSSASTPVDGDKSKEAIETIEQQPETIKQKPSSSLIATQQTQTNSNIENRTGIETENDTTTVIDLYTAIPAHVVEDTASSLDTVSQQSIQSANTTTSDDSDTIKIYNFKKQQTTIIKETKEKPNEQNTDENLDQTANQAPAAATKERPTALSFNKSESIYNSATVTTPTRGSTPDAFKFLQPKRKLLDPSQVLSLDEDEPQISIGSIEKPVIEKEVVKALPSVKALARAFLMTSGSMQHTPSRVSWPRKAKTLPEGQKSPTKPSINIEPAAATDDKSEEDATIASDLSSLETDSLSVVKQPADCTNEHTPQTTCPALSTTNTPAASTPASPVFIRQGILRKKLAFFENLKNLK